MKITSLRIRSVDPVVYGEDLEFEFQLTYDGPLHAASQKNTRSREKHLIRKRLHSQLEKVWKRLHPATPRSPVLDNFSSTYGTTTEGVNKLLEPIERERFRFMPIVRSAEQRVCELDILFMRREEPGYVIVRSTSGEESGGDLDNRIKTLFDALQVPDENQAALLTPAPDEDPL